jgi:hypothetical protein
MDLPPRKELQAKESTLVEIVDKNILLLMLYKNRVALGWKCMPLSIIVQNVTNGTTLGAVM